MLERQQRAIRGIMEHSLLSGSQRLSQSSKALLEFPHIRKFERFRVISGAAGQTGQPNDHSYPAEFPWIIWQHTRQEVETARGQASLS